MITTDAVKEDAKHQKEPDSPDRILLPQVIAAPHIHKYARLGCRDWTLVTRYVKCNTKRLLALASVYLVSKPDSL